MKLPECREQFDLLMRYYEWLVEDHGFTVIGMLNGSMNSCSFLLQQGDCRVFLSVDRGQVDFPQVALAPADNKLDALATGLQWYHVVDITDYLRGEFSSWSQIEERLRLEENLSADEILRRHISDFRALWPQVLVLFQQDEFVFRQIQLEEFLKIKRATQAQQRKERMIQNQGPPQIDI